MGKITADAIRLKLSKIIREQTSELQWNGIDTKMIEKVDNVQPVLANGFQYEGSGEYEFSAHVSFMVKETNTEFGMHRESYKISPFCKMSINEIDNDFNIDIISPIPLQKI